MAEEVETGGLMRFRYSGEHAKLSEAHKKDIEAAYARADERKQKEKARRRALWIVGIIAAVILISIILYVLLK